MPYAAPAQGGGSNISFFLMLLLVFGAMYFLLIRPQQKRRRTTLEMQSQIGPGDEVLTIGGLFGVVQEIDDDYVVLEVATGITNRYARTAISSVVNKADSDDEIADEDEAVEPDITGSTTSTTTSSTTTSNKVDTTKVIDTD
jgi:preprotein translocase subunit YajC